MRAFRPFPLLRSPHLQTLLACAQLGREPSSRTCRVRLVDGDQLAVEVSTPAGWTANAPTVVLVHGLCGCHGSPYMVRMTDKLVRRGVRVLRVNLRGCGSGRGLARELYHSGRSDDVLQVLRSFRDEAPDSRTTLVGFSLGGNVALKLAGELGADAAAYLHRVIAVSAPADLEACARRIGRPENRFYERHFIRLLRRAVAERHAAFPDLPAVELPRSLGLFEFDDVYTAPHGGFESALDYYRKSSSAPLVPRIEVPCHVLFADDDPFVRADVFDGVELPANVEVVRTRHGGHLGFLGRPGPGGAYRWMDSQLLAWILEEEAPQRPGFRS
ncbi:MAG: alpha/beta fold hydrolase [Planctomycetota bacterium]|nr:alpha/beta fold hydrolase [Planctomycetota bacterium]